MSDAQFPGLPSRIECGLNAEQLHIGLCEMDEGSLDSTSFWDEHVVSFRESLLFAIRETSDALRSPTIPPSWSLRLERQLESLIQYVELADRYISRRHLSFGGSAPGLPSRPAARRPKLPPAGQRCGGR